MSTAEQVEKHGFQTEVKELLHLVVNSLYSNKEIFLRELISNASDANDKLRYLAISHGELYENDPDLKIQVEFDDKAKTVTIRDNGIGMNREDVIRNLGTIARSGTKEFIANLSGNDAQDSNLIGQFGVGFYSVFIVADKVTVYSRKAGEAPDTGVKWISDGKGEYSLENATRANRGTEIIVHLKKSEDEFLSDWRLKGIINKYSDHISWPVMMLQKQFGENGKEDKEEFEQINKATAIWTRNKKEITDQEYKEFYKHISHDIDEPMMWSHNQVEGKHEYTTLLYVPKKAPYDLWHHEVQRGLKLYAKRVFIMDKVDQFLPRYLRFVKGIVDSADLPLNVSREILQENRLVDTIRNTNVKKILGILEKMAEREQEQYQIFWDEFGLVLKEGPIEDYPNKEEIAKLLRFSTTHIGKPIQDQSLMDYISRMKEGQDKIYYLTAESFNAAKGSPHLEVFRDKGIEVLLLTDKIDEWLVSHLSEFDGKPLQSVTKGELNLGKLEDKEEEKKTEAAEKELASVLEQFKKVLKDEVKDVRFTHRLTSSPACVVADENDMGREMQRILEQAGQKAPPSKPILELNPKHVMVTRLEKETDDDNFAEWARIIFEQALLAESGRLDNPGEFVSRMNQFLSRLSD